MSNSVSVHFLSWKLVCRNISPVFWLLLVLLCFLAYSRGIQGYFVFDDNPLIANDQFYSTESNPLKCWDRGFWSDGRGGLYRPLVVFSYWLNARISGLDPHMFRACNLFLHIIATILVYILAKRLSFGITCAMLASVIYATHPLHSEAIIPAFGRAELLCAVFFMVGLIFHIRRTSSNGSSLTAGLFFLLALWSKEHAVAFLPLCLLYDFIWKRAKDRHLAIRYVVYAIFISIFLFSKYSALHSIVPSKDRTEALIDNRLALCPAPERVVSAIRIQGITLFKFIFPETLSHDYSYAQILPSGSIYDPGAIITLAFFIGMPALLIWLYPGRKKHIVFLALSYAICIIPSGNFIVPAGTIYAERLTYIPSIWLSVFFSLLLIRILLKIPFKIVLLAISMLLFAMSYRTILRCSDWHDRASLAVAGVRTSPKSVKSWANLAVQFEEKGQFAEAVEACNVGLSIYSKDSSLYLKRGTYYTRLDMNIEAEEDFRKALALNPENIQASINLAIVMANTGRTNDAKKILKATLDKHPSQKAVSEMLRSLDSK